MEFAYLYNTKEEKMAIEQFFTLLIVLFLTIFWMVLFWRLMRVHEKLADSVEWIARQNSRQEQQSNPLGDD